MITNKKWCMYYISSELVTNDVLLCDSGHRMFEPKPNSMREVHSHLLYLIFMCCKNSHFPLNEWPVFGCRLLLLDCRTRHRIALNNIRFIFLTCWGYSSDAPSLSLGTWWIFHAFLLVARILWMRMRNLFMVFVSFLPLNRTQNKKE